MFPGIWKCYQSVGKNNRRLFVYGYIDDQMIIGESENSMFGLVPVYPPR